MIDNLQLCLNFIRQTRDCLRENKSVMAYDLLDDVERYAIKAGTSPRVVAEIKESDINARVVKVISDHLGVPKTLIIDGNSHIEDDLRADSLDCVELVIALEEEFNIEIPDCEVNDIKLIKEVIQLVNSKLEKETL